MCFFFDFKEYSDVGAFINNDMSEASLIIGVKQVPVDLLMRNKTYAFFSHTIKAQADNMPLLDAILEKVNIISCYCLLVKSQYTLIYLRRQPLWK